MTIEDFNLYNENKDMPYEDIGQGMGYKDTDFDWYNGNPTDIIYIPEYGYDDKGYVKREDAFSKNDFIELVRTWIEDNDCKAFDKEIERLALTIFDMVDWQFPASLIDNDGVLDDYFSSDDD